MAQQLLKISAAEFRRRCAQDPNFPSRCWNPRYICYCRALGIEPGSDGAWEYALWNREQINAFLIEFPEHEAFGSLDSQKAHVAYDNWLEAKYPESELANV
jgi:hypothetical protein